MNIVFAGAMISIMALCVSGAVLPLGSVNAELAFPAFVCAALIALLWSGWLSFSSQATWKASPMHWPVLCFLIYALIRYFFSPLEYEARIELFQIFLCGFVYFVCAIQFHRPVERTIILAVLMLLALFESGYGMWQAFSKTDEVLGWIRPEGYRGRGSGSLICPNHLAGLLEIILGLVVARVAFVRREHPSLERSIILKVVTIYVLIMIVAGIVLTFSRAGWAATTIGLLVFFFVGGWRPHLSWPRLAVAVFLLGCMALLIGGFEPVTSYFTKSVTIDERTSAVSLTDPTIGGRTTMWKDTARMIADYPIFGTGGGSWDWIYQRYKSPAILSRPDYAHNDFLNLISDYGIIGFLLVGWFFFGFFRHAIVLSRVGNPPDVRAFAAGAMISTVAILVHSWFDSSLHIPGVSVVLAVIFGFTAAMNDHAGRFPRKPIRVLPRWGLAVATLAICGIGMWHFVPTALATRYTDFGNRLKNDLNYDLAMAFYDYALDWDLRNPETFARIGDIYRTWANWRLGPEKAVERKELALQGIEAYERSLQLNPNQSFVLTDKARLHELAGQPEEALSSYEKAIQVYPSNALTHFLLGCYFRDRGDAERARKAFGDSKRFGYSYSADLNYHEFQTPP